MTKHKPPRLQWYWDPPGSICFMRNFDYDPAPIVGWRLFAIVVLWK